MFFSPVKCETAQQRIERAFGEPLNIAKGHSYVESCDRGTRNPIGASVLYSQVSGAVNSYFQMEGTTGIIEYGLSDNGTDQVLWTLNQTVFPVHNIAPSPEIVKTTKFTAYVQSVQIVGGGIIGAIIGQNVALDEYGRHAFFRFQNTNGGSLFAVNGNDQDDSTETELMTQIAGHSMKLELTIRESGLNSFKATDLRDGQVGEANPAGIVTPQSIMNLMFAAEGGGPQKYRIYYWRLDYD